MMHSNEPTVLAWAGQLDPDEEYLQKFRYQMAKVKDTNHLIDLAVKEGLAGFLYKILLKADLLESLNPQHKQRLYTTYYLTIRHNLKLAHALNKLLKPLVQKQVQVILVQGISLLQEVYRDIGLRPMVDIDLWVLPDQYAELIEALDSQGFKMSTVYPDSLSKGEVVIDIHTHILDGHPIRSKDVLICFGREEIFEDARRINPENSAALCLNPSDQFLYLSLHALKHNLARMIWLVDIKCLVENWEPADWQALQNRAEELDQQTTVFYMLFVLTHIFKFSLPLEISSYLKAWRPNLFERRALSRRIKGSPLPTWSHLMLTSAGNGIGERISFVRDSLSPKPKIS